MKKVFISWGVFALFLCLISCSNSNSGNIMGFKDNLVGIEEFPKKIVLSDAEPVRLDIIGINDIAIHDSLMFFGTQDKMGSWKIVNLNTMQLIGEFLAKGNGPNEIVQVPWPSNSEIVVENGTLVSYLKDMDKRRMLRFDITKSPETGHTQLETVGENLPYPCFTCIYLSDSTFFCSSVSPDMTRQERFIFRNGENIYPEGLSGINAAHIEGGKDINILSRITSYSRQRNLLVESSVRLNCINIYSPDGTDGRTIYYGSSVDDIDDIQLISYKDMPKSFSEHKLFNDFFAIQYLDETVFTYQMKRKDYSRIFLIDYDGNPLSELHLDRAISTYDIDLTNGMLYVIGYPDEGIYRYRLPEELGI